MTLTPENAVTVLTFASSAHTAGALRESTTNDKYRLLGATSLPLLTANVLTSMKRVGVLNARCWSHAW